MRVAVIGSRTFGNYDFLEKVVNSHKPSIIVSGGARGADTLAERYAHEKGLGFKVFYPLWDTLGKAAGLIRNKEIVDNSDIVIAFWDGQSRGTKHAIDYATQQQKPVYIHRF